MQLGPINTSVLEVIFGLAFLYAFLSTLCSAIVEMISAAWNWRGVVLCDSLRQMLGDTPCDKFYKTLLIKGLRHETFKSKRSKQESDRRDPAYIPPHTFALALLQILREKAAAGAAPINTGVSPRTLDNFLSQDTPPDTTHDEIANLRDTVALIATDINYKRTFTDTTPVVAPATQSEQIVSTWTAATSDVTARLEAWYGSVMERATGAYKRKTQIGLAVIALILCFAGNIDLFRAARVFWTDTLTRGAIVAANKNIGTTTDGTKQLQDYAKSVAQKMPSSAGAARDTERAKQLEDYIKSLPQNVPTPTPAQAPDRAKQLQDFQTSLDQSVPLPIGWPYSPLSLMDRFIAACLSGAIWSKLGGISLSVIALMLGAPFWFDTISRFYSLRSTGTPPKITDSSGFATAQISPASSNPTNTTPPVQNSLTVNTPAAAAQTPFDPSTLSGDYLTKYKALPSDKQQKFVTDATSVNLAAQPNDLKAVFLADWFSRNAAAG